MKASACATCKVGPGKFQGEGAATALLYVMMLDGCGDESASNGVGAGSAELFEGPIEGDADLEWIAFAIAQGFCDEHVAVAIEELEQAIGAIVVERSDGFVSSTVYQKGQGDEMSRDWDEAVRTYGDGYDGSEEGGE